MAADARTAPQIWSKTVDIVKDRVNNRSFWEALEQAVGITLEDDLFIIGLNPRIFNHAGHLTVSDHRNAIERALSEIVGRPVRTRVIEGDTLEDWANTKKRDARVAASREATYERRAREEAAAASWDTLLEQIARTYSNLPLRQLPQVKARFLTDMLYAVSDAMDALYPAQPDEASERHLARVIDKVAGGAEVPPALVALELERLRAWRRQEESA